ncbi:unnamed protein product [Rotaria sp. Silwood2]|nr:unnamed protein product [Rotaria sp. Silwood2]CAF2702521.1 unnamed protein product [Rotaria sp. Silwood2]CAF3134255.1 unnamed protein product [Rotaria sp. Silwood2]CAF3362270.1 unnamed protein product [Rotaria sp. Silwood2]CAF3889679.1 unnamed protein product [Rotaria sp. Silwood2]
MSDENDTLQEEFYSGSDLALPISARFWLYLIPNVLSILCSFFVLHHLLFHRNRRQALHNHVFIVLLFIGLLFELIDIPLTLHYYRFGDSWQLTPSVSLFWTYIDFALYTAQIIIFAWATIERHIITFEFQWISTKKKRFFIHYLPLVTLLMYVFIYCCFIIYFPPCKQLYYHSYINGVPIPCIIEKTIIGKFDLICHQIIPTFVIVIFSIALCFRILYEKSRLNRSIQWRKQRKMATQLLNTSMLYFIFNFPWTLIDLSYEIGLSVDYIIRIRSYAYYFSCYIIFLFPFVCCGSLSKLRKKVKKFLCGQRNQRIVGPQSIAMRHMLRTRFDQNESTIH